MDKYNALLTEARQAFLTDSHYAIDIAKDAGAERASHQKLMDRYGLTLDEAREYKGGTWKTQTRVKRQASERLKSKEENGQA